MADFITITVEGAEQLAVELKGFDDDLGHTVEDSADALEELVYEMVRAQYDSRGRRGPTGRPWTRKQSTIDAETRANRKGFRFINSEMERTGALRTSETRRGAPHQIREVRPNEIILGTDLGYGLIQDLRGQKQYDPTDKDVKQAEQIMLKRIGSSAISHHLEYRDSEIPF